MAVDRLRGCHGLAVHARLDRDTPDPSGPRVIRRELSRDGWPPDTPRDRKSLARSSEAVPSGLTKVHSARQAVAIYPVSRTPPSRGQVVPGVSVSSFEVWRTT